MGLLSFELYHILLVIPLGPNSFMSVSSTGRRKFTDKSSGFVGINPYALKLINLRSLLCKICSPSISVLNMFAFVVIAPVN